MALESLGVAIEEMVAWMSMGEVDADAILVEVVDIVVAVATVVAIVVVAVVN